MFKNDTITAYQCVQKVTVISSGILALVVLPINFLVFKILVSNFRLALPRHKILLSLTISDSLQISFVALLSFLAQIANLKTTSIACQAIRTTIGVVAIWTVITSSGSILTLSVERYFACIHCFQAHRIISDQRTVRTICGFWLVGIICALADSSHYRANLGAVTICRSKITDVMYTSVVLPSTIILLFIQTRLFLLSRRLMRVIPGTSNAFGSAAEAIDLRKRAWKVSIVASAVVVLYVFCMCPLAFYFIATLFEKSNELTPSRFTAMFLVQFNAFADPFVYGLGMADMRQAMIRELRRDKEFFKNMIC